MKIELISFRLMLLIVVGSALGFGCSWVYSANQANDWQVLVSSAFKKMNQAEAACEKNRASTSCGFYEIWKESFDGAVKSRDQLRERANLFALLVLIIPVISLVLFYSLRWALTGRLKPWIVRDNPRVAPISEA